MAQVTPNERFIGDYRRRIVDEELDALLPHLPAIHLDGPKAVGKTATALQRAATVHRLHRDGERLVAEGDPERLLDGDRPVLMDEWQKVPSLWEVVKAAADQDNSGGQYILTGSTPQKGTHSGAGRITSVRMRPLTLPERGVSDPTVSLGMLLAGQSPAISGSCPLLLTDYADLILASGFPGFQHLAGKPLHAQLDSYLTHIVDTDIAEETGRQVRKPELVSAWLKAYAAATATTASWETIREAASPGSSPAKTTAFPYRDALARLRILDDVPAWIPGNNHLKELGQAPKHFLVDPALAARLVGVEKAALLQGEGPTATPGTDTFLGALFESLVAMSLQVFAGPSGATVHHLRTHRGEHEVDFIVKIGNGKVVAMEVKLSGIVRDKDVKHLTWLKSILGDAFLDSVVVYTGSTAYRRPDGIAVVPLGLLGP